MVEAAAGEGRIKEADGCCARYEAKWVSDDGRTGEGVRERLDGVITWKEERWLEEGEEGMEDDWRKERKREGGETRLYG